MGPHTHSAGTSEIALDSGGDSFPVDDGYALENTLSRLRQRYALHFLAPEGAKPGEERTIQVLLSDAARRRYPDADLRFRKLYRTPEGSGNATAVASTEQPTSSATPSEPVVVNPSPTMKRRQAVDEPSSGGPRLTESAPQQPTGGWRSVNDPEPPAPATTDSKDQGPWRKAKPNDQ
jgi:hypothetical protein